MPEFVWISDLKNRYLFLFVMSAFLILKKANKETKTNPNQNQSPDI